jgi:squalene-hopene/tetraprenyl-beta-curcumene cyclase
VGYLLRIQKPDGSWGGDAHAEATVEETALSVAALAAWGKAPEIAPALSRGLNYLSDRVEDGTFTMPSPIGLYFASLWYSEALYPVIWTLEALGRAQTAKAP